MHGVYGRARVTLLMGSSVVAWRGSWVCGALSHGLLAVSTPLFPFISSGHYHSQATPRRQRNGPPPPPPSPPQPPSSLPSPVLCHLPQGEETRWNGRGGGWREREGEAEGRGESTNEGKYRQGKMKSNDKERRGKESGKVGVKNEETNTERRGNERLKQTERGRRGEKKQTRESRLGKLRETLKREGKKRARQTGNEVKEVRALIHQATHTRPFQTRQNWR